MRVLVALLAFAIAPAAAAAQIYQNPAERVAQDEAARRRDVEITNQLSVLDAQLRTQQALRDLQAMSPPPVPAQPNPNIPLPVIDTSKLASIPDKALADSNVRVRAAAQNRR